MVAELGVGVAFMGRPRLMHLGEPSTLVVSVPHRFCQTAPKEACGGSFECMMVAELGVGMAFMGGPRVVYLDEPFTWVVFHPA